MSRWRLPVELH